MGFVTVEKHVFYLRPQEYSNGQMQMWVRNIRLPWRPGSPVRTVGYLDDAQFGALSGRVGGREIQNMKNFFLGKGHAHPKLIVANVREGDIYTRDEISKKFFEDFKRNFRPTPGRMPNPGLKEDDEKFLTYSQRMARYKTGGTKRGSREAAPVRAPEKMYRPHFQKHYFNTAWLIVDPTRPGRSVVPRDRALRLAKNELKGRFSNVLFLNQRQKVMDKDAVVILGVGYMLQYWQKRLPPQDVRWLESVQSRVRTHLLKELKSPAKRIDVTQTWYIMGKHEMPPLSSRYHTTKQGRVRLYRTFRAGRGIMPSSPDEQFQLKPLFTVTARNAEDAQDKAERKLARMIDSKNDTVKEQGLDWEAAWYAASRKVLSVAAIRMLKNQ